MGWGKQEVEEMCALFDRIKEAAGAVVKYSVLKLLSWNFVMSSQCPKPIQ